MMPTRIRLSMTGKEYHIFPSLSEDLCRLRAAATSAINASRQEIKIRQFSSIVLSFLVVICFILSAERNYEWQPDSVVRLA